MQQDTESSANRTSTLTGPAQLGTHDLHLRHKTKLLPQPNDQFSAISMGATAVQHLGPTGPHAAASNKHLHTPPRGLSCCTQPMAVHKRAQRARGPCAATCMHHRACRAQGVRTTTTTIPLRAAKRDVAECIRDREPPRRTHADPHMHPYVRPPLCSPLRTFRPRAESWATQAAP